MRIRNDLELVGESVVVSQSRYRGGKALMKPPKRKQALSASQNCLLLSSVLARPLLLVNKFLAD